MDSMGVTYLEWNNLGSLTNAEKEVYYTSYDQMEKIRDAKLKKMSGLPPAVNVSDFIDHIDYLVNKIGIDHVGISSDFDGGGGIEGWNDASETFNVTLELVRRGYTEDQISKLWSENLLRVLDEVTAVAEKWQSN